MPPHHSRTSPSLTSPPAHQATPHLVNGPTSVLVKNIPNRQQQQQQQHQPLTVTSTAASLVSSGGEQMSTLKTIAQEVVNRTAMEVTASSQVPLAAPSSMNPHSITSGIESRLAVTTAGTAAYVASAVFINDPTSATTATATQNGPNLSGGSVTPTLTSTTVSTGGTVKTAQPAATNEAHIPPLLGVAPLGPSPLQKEHQIQVR